MSKQQIYEFQVIILKINCYPGINCLYWIVHQTYLKKLPGSINYVAIFYHKLVKNIIMS